MPSHSSRKWLAALTLLALAVPGTASLAAQKTGVRRAGDVLQIAIPALALAGTGVAHDSEGTGQFLKGFLTNVAATGALKLAIARERPDGSDDNSFPSGHTSAAFQGASFIHLRYGWRKGIPAYAGAAFVGFSRLYADKHYVSDVVAGAALGILSSRIFTSRFEKLEVIPAAEGGRVGVEVRIRWGPRPSTFGVRTQFGQRTHPGALRPPQVGERSRIAPLRPQAFRP